MTVFTCGKYLYIKFDLISFEKCATFCFKKILKSKSFVYQATYTDIDSETSVGLIILYIVLRTILFNQK